LAVQPLSAASANAETPGPQTGGPATIVVQIQSRGAPDDPITWGGGKKKTRCFRLYCEHSYFHPITSICVEFSSGTTPLQLAALLEAEVQAAIHSIDCLELCNYKVKLVNNSLIITGTGADHFAGSADEPVYEGEGGSDFTDDGKPKNNPLCRLAIFAQ
jgi:hypothetical protein